MTKRFIAALLTILILLPVAFSAGSFVVAPEMLFADEDRQREEAIAGALSQKGISDMENSEILSEENRYIIKFKDSVSLSHIGKVLEGKEFTLLAESEDRIFAVAGANHDFLEENEDMIEYYEEDIVRNVLATVNDPASMTSYSSMGIFDAWDITTGKSDVIVAVLDTGIARNHEDLVNVNILAGYDAVSRKAGVNSDTAGHGTGVAGIIAATANNGLGIAGVAHGVTILPIKVSSAGTTIYSSDLVRGIRFAADAGAKIINMSLGGYSSSVAEQEAVFYALSKGCILISAAGNGGNSEYADQKSYPASYEGVISVASCDTNGDRSNFSQYNDGVDVSAIGENITMPFVDEEGRSVYRTDSGTSYSCAIVSGIAALAASRIDGSARFEADEFQSLIIEICGTEKDERFGYGIINAQEIVSVSAQPIITGVIQGGEYSESVKIGFNRGTATLNGESIEDGETVIANGKHTLTVTYGYITKTVDFRLNYKPLSYKFNEFATYAYFTFDRGNATLNGFPYVSGEKITVSGRHEFVLFDGEERLEKAVELSYSLPTVFGVEDGKTYENPIEIAVVGNGTATLDGKEIHGETVISQSGDHVLKVTNGSNTESKEYKFRIDFPAGYFADIDYAEGTPAVDEENGYICLYGDSLVGARIYDISNPEKYACFLPVGRIYGHAFIGDMLYLFGDMGITVLDRKTALKGQVAVINSYDHSAVTHYIYGMNTIFGFGGGNIYVFDTETESFMLLADVGYNCEKAFYDKGKLYMLSPSTDSIVRIYDIENNTVAQYDLGHSVPGADICFGNGYLAVGSRLYNADNGQLLLEFASHRAVMITEDYLYTETRIVELATGRELASFPFPVHSITSTATRNYIYGTERKFASVDRTVAGANGFGAAARNDKAFSSAEASTPYRNNTRFDKNTPISTAASVNLIYMICTDRNVLYQINSDLSSELPPLPLKYSPSKVIYENGYIAVLFGNAPYVYIANGGDVTAGKYIRISAPCKDAAITNNRIYALINGTVVLIDITTGDAVVTEIVGNDIASNADSVFLRNGSTISKYSLDMIKSPVSFTNIAGYCEMQLGSAVAIDRKIFSFDGNLIATTDSKIIAFKGCTVITENGVFDLVSKEYVGTTGIENPEFVSVCGNNSVAAFGNGTLAVNYCSEGDEVVTDPEIWGIEEFQVYHGSASFGFRHGIGYVDGKPFNSDDVITEVGNHIFYLSLPCGRNITISFVIEAEVAEIKFLLEENTISVGEKLALQVVYLPEGSSSIPVVFSWDAEGITIDESGVVTALEVGGYEVTATAETANGSLSATTEIQVRSDLIAPLPESGLQVNRNNSLLTEIPPGTTLPQLLASLMNSDSVEVWNESDEPIGKYIATGNRIVLFDDEGNITDELFAVVRGDTDGDGLISAYDLYDLERILKGYYYDDAFVFAADTNANGVVANNDYRTLEKMLFGRIEAELGSPDSSLFGNCSIQNLPSAAPGEIIDVAICISGFKDARGIFGSVAYDEGLSFVGFESEWTMDCYNNDGKIHFYAYDETDPDEAPEDSTFRILLNLRFRVEAPSGTSLLLLTDSLTVSTLHGCKEVACNNGILSVSAKSYGDFDIIFANGDGFNFDPTVHEYSVKIPHNQALADITVVHKENESATVSTLLIPESGEETVVVTYRDENGSTEYYSITVVRDAPPEIDNNCRLDVLEVEGHRLSPKFDPDVFEYDITVPYGTEKINVYCIAQNITAGVVVGDTSISGGKDSVVITVGAIDGETLTYTINVTVEPKIEIPDDSTSHEPAEQPNPSQNLAAQGEEPAETGGFAGLIFGGIALVTLCTVYYFKRETIKAKCKEIFERIKK